MVFVHDILLPNLDIILWKCYQPAPIRTGTWTTSIQSCECGAWKTAKARTVVQMDNLYGCHKTEFMYCPMLLFFGSIWPYFVIFGNIWWYWQPLLVFGTIWEYMAMFGMLIFGTGDIWEYLDRPFGDFLTQTREWIDFPAEAAPIWKAIPSTLIFHIETLVSLGSMAISGT